MKSALCLLVMVLGVTACSPEQAADLNTKVDTMQNLVSTVNNQMYKAGVTASAAVASVPSTPQEAVTTLTTVGTAVVDSTKEAAK